MSLALLLKRVTLVRGDHGEGDECCSMQALNLYESSEKTDRLLPNMSGSMRELIIALNDNMNEADLNSDRWKELLVRAYDTEAHPDHKVLVDLWTQDQLRKVKLPPCGAFDEVLERFDERSILDYEMKHCRGPNSVHLILSYALRVYLGSDLGLGHILNVLVKQGLVFDPYSIMEDLCTTHKT